MKKFLKGFARNFVALLLVFTGIKFWRDDSILASLACFAALGALIVWQVMEMRKRRRGGDLGE